MNDTRWSVLLDFLEQYRADGVSGKARPVDAYVTRFPGFEDAIRAEYARLQEPAAGTESKRAQLAPSAAGTAAELEVIATLRERARVSQRYSRANEIGRGGMSRVYLARDFELDRELAMKVHQGERAGALRRFIREARLLGKLDHPGVVPIHELGLDDDGRVYFTMRLVRGQSLKQRFADLAAKPEPAAHRGALEAILRVCDTMAFAHSQGVIHRDLKPSNVMLGEFGEVYVVDWGLARVIARAEDARGDDEETALGADAPLETLAGDVLGTPAYMPPEQARGSLDEIGPRSDIYSVGAILYHLLAGHAPFHESGSTQRSSEVVARVLAGAPAPLARTARDAPAELVAICERAMARDPARRYASCGVMAADLRAYLDGRVVQAHRTGVIVRAQKWIARNRALAAASSGAILLATGALVTWRQSHAREQSLDLLADLRGPLELLDEFDTLWPATPEHKDAIAQWVARADRLRERGALYESELEAIRANEARRRDSTWVEQDFRERHEKQLAAAMLAREETNGRLIQAEQGHAPPGSSSVAQLRANLESLDRNIAGLRVRPDEKVSTNFADSHVQLLHDRLDQFLTELDSVIGRTQDRARAHLARAALALADRVATTETSELESRWDEAIRGVGESPIYRGLVLPPQRGLVPLGADPRSGLWEFAHVQSGSVPTRDAEGRLRLESDAAIVLVLVPGGLVTAGSQRADPATPAYDPNAERFEGPPIGQAVRPFFISKFEMTIAQWTRLSGEPPSDDAPRMPRASCDGRWSASVLRAYELELPTSIYWEYAARAGTDTPWWTGSDLASLAGAANIADCAWFDAMHEARGYEATDIAGAVNFDDGYNGLAPVGMFRPNAFGLHDTMGNVAEWCRDRTIPYRSHVLVEGAELLPAAFGMQLVRGGSVEEGAFGVRSAARLYVTPEYMHGFLGVRPARRLNP